MHSLIIHKLGPINHCEIQCTQFMTLTGFQASGKSTIAKAIYYFRTIKDDIMELAKQQALETSAAGIELGSYVFPKGNSLKKATENCLREKFLRTFGSSWGMPNDMYMEYHFTENCVVRVSLKEEVLKYSAPNYIWITFSKGLRDFLSMKDRSLSATPLGVPEEEEQRLWADLYKLFDDKYSVVYIPAGRSMITQLSQQLNYIYATMDDVQKRSLDSCTKDYMERILKLKPQFSDGLDGLVAYQSNDKQVSAKTVKTALNLINKILKGSYRYVNGEEQIVLDGGKYVKLNFSSSGQQESVWILNLLFYYLLRRQQILFIIEEPESHLFPESQKYITELIALVSNNRHSVVLTTHSPYVLGTLNNLIYAHEFCSRFAVEAEKVIPKKFWINSRDFDAWFIKDGIAENCMDQDIYMIQNERIDEISKVINQDFEKLLLLQNLEKDGGA